MQITEHHLHTAASALTRVLTTIGVQPLEAHPDNAFRLISQSITFDQGPDQADLEMTAIENAARAAADPVVRPQVTRFLAGRPMVQHMLDLAAASIPDDLEPLHAELNGHPPDKQPRPGKHDAFEPISAADMELLIWNLNRTHDPLDSMFHPDLRQLDGLTAAVIAEASWATGARPAEWPSAAIEVEHDGQRQHVHDIFRQAINDDPPPQPTHNRPGFLAHTRALLTRILTAGPVWLQVNSVKRKHLAAAGLPLTRSIGLHHAPIGTKIAATAAVYLASRHTASGPSAWRSTCRRLNIRLQNASRELFPERRKLITLYEFRHDFLDRCKALLTPAEVATLAGHSSLVSKQHYGRPRHQCQGSGVMPAFADPEEVAIFEAHLLPKRTAAQPPTPPRQLHPPSASISPAPAPTPGGMP